jgi:hypothetical protein
VVGQAFIDIADSCLSSVGVDYFPMKNLNQSGTTSLSNRLTRRHVAEHLRSIDANPVEGRMREYVDVIPMKKI